MSEHIQPDKITKPIQLLGAWLVGLLAIDSCFLIAAASMDQGSWESIALVIAAIGNVPLFLVAVFLLQTKFRPELQEDAYYSTYISQKTNVKVQVPKEELGLSQLTLRIDRLENALTSKSMPSSLQNPQPSLSKLKIGVNKHLKNREAISKALAGAGIAGFSTFGSNEIPKEQVVSISYHLADDFIPIILGLAKSVGFRRYNFFDNEFENTDEAVLIGSYGSGEFEIADV